MNPADLRYTPDHEWVGLEGALAVIGISHHAQQALGDVTFVELPKIGRTLKCHDVLGVVESVKAASDIFAPVTGKVVAVNEALNTSQERINQDPYGAGWICQFSGVQATDLSGLMTLAQYEAFCAGK